MQVHKLTNRQNYKANPGALSVIVAMSAVGQSTQKNTTFLLDGSKSWLQTAVKPSVGTSIIIRLGFVGICQVMVAGRGVCKWNGVGWGGNRIYF